MLNKKVLIFITGIIMIFVITAWIIVIENKQIQPGLQTPEEIDDSINSSLLKNAELIIFNKDKTLKWELKSETISQEQKQDLLDLKKITVKAYNLKTEKMIYTFTANQGQYFNSNQISFKGEIEFEKDEYHLFMGNLKWEHTNNKIKGGQGFSLSAPSFNLRGNSFESDSGFNRIIVSGNKDKQAQFSWKE